MADVVYGGKADAAFGCFPPRHPAHGKVGGAYDRELAARLLDEAGWAKGRDGKRTKTSSTSGARELAMVLQFASGSQASERAASFVQAELAKIGVTVTLESMPLRVLFAKMREKSHAPLALFAWRSSPDFDAQAMLRTGGAQNYAGLADPELDRLLDRAKRERDPAAWAKTLSAVDLRYRELLPTIPLLFRKAVSVRPRSLDGFSPTGSQTPVTWNAERWRWTK
jgi:peptide/nickel transport system substrate-binding protein